MIGLEPGKAESAHPELGMLLVGKRLSVERWGPGQRVLGEKEDCIQIKDLYLTNWQQKPMDTLTQRKEISHMVCREVNNGAGNCCW